MRRILLLITDLQIGGTPTVVRELALRLREPGRVEVSVACLSPWGPVAEQLRDAGVDVTAFDAASSLHLPRTVLRLIRLVRERNFDTVFSFLVHANAVAAIASFALPGVRFLQSIQTTQPNPRWHWRLQRAVESTAERVVVPSPSAARIATDWAGVPASKLAVIPNAVDIESFDAVFHSRRPLDPRAIRVGFIGRFDPVKRIPDLLHAFAPLAASQTKPPSPSNNPSLNPNLGGMGMSSSPWNSLAGGAGGHGHESMPMPPQNASRQPRAWHLDLYGDGAERARLLTEIDRLHLHDHVTLHGAIPSPHAALASMDVLVLPSQAEGFGLVLIEAMAAGVPVVATDAPGIRDVVEHERTGLLSPVGDAAALRTNIERAAEPGEVRDRLIVNGRREVEAKYGWPVVLGVYRTLLRIVPGTPGTSPAIQ